MRRCQFLRRTVASYSQRQIFRQRSFSPVPRVQVLLPLPPSRRFSHLGRRCSADRPVSFGLQRTCAPPEYPPAPSLFHASPFLGTDTCVVGKFTPHVHTPSSLPPALSAMATDGSGSVSPASLDSTGQFTPAQLAIIQEMIINAARPSSASTETRTTTGAHPVPPESHPGPSTSTGESG